MLPRVRNVLLALTTLVACYGQPKSHLGWVKWVDESDAAYRRAKEQGKPLLLEVWAGWCPPCRKMDREVWTDKRIVEAASKFVCVSLDIARRDIAEVETLVFGTHGRYKVHALPTVFILDPWREVILVSEGYIYPKELLAILNEIPADYNPVRPAREALIANRNNSRALEQVGELYERSHGYGIANRYYREALTMSGAKESDRLREDLTFGVAMNEIRRADWGAARKWLTQFRDEFPTSNRTSQAMLGMVLSDLRQGRRQSAEERVAELEKSYPNSEAAVTARRLTAAKMAAKR